MTDEEKAKELASIGAPLGATRHDQMKAIYSALVLARKEQREKDISIVKYKLLSRYNQLVEFLEAAIRDQEV